MNKKLTTILAVLTIFLTPGEKIVAADCSLREGFAYRSSQSADIYYITDNCTKQLFRSEADFLTYFDSTSRINRIDDLTLRVIPNDVEKYVPLKETTGNNSSGNNTGNNSGSNTSSNTSGRATTIIVRDGSLIKSRTKNEVYLVINNIKYHIENMETFNELGMQPQWIEIVSDRTLDAIPSGSSLNMFPNTNLMSQAAVNYMLFKDRNSPAVYRVEPSSTDPKYQVLRKISNEQTFKKLNYRADRLPQVTISSIAELSVTGIGAKTIFRPGTELNSNSTISYTATFDNILKERQSAMTTNAYARNEKYDKVYFEYPRKFKIIRGFSYARAFNDEYLVAFMMPKNDVSALYLSVIPLPTKNKAYTSSELRKQVDITHEYTTGFEDTESKIKTWNTENKTHTTLGYTTITTKEFVDGVMETRLTLTYKNNIFSGLIRHAGGTRTELEELFYYVATTFKRIK